MHPVVRAAFKAVELLMKWLEGSTPSSSAIYILNILFLLYFLFYFFLFHLLLFLLLQWEDIFLMRN